MTFVLTPSHLFFLILSGWVNRRQQQIIDFQNAQIRTLMEQLGRKRILLTDRQRRLRNLFSTDPDGGFQPIMTPPAPIYLTDYLTGSGRLSHGAAGEEVWPRRRSLKMFLEWFDVQVSEMVFDLGRGAMHSD